MSDAGGYRDLKNASLMFDDSAASALPDSETIAPGRYRPANHNTPPEPLPPGASGPDSCNLLALAAAGANGEWKLYAADDAAGDTGKITSWTISFETTPPPVPTFTLNYSAAANGTISGNPLQSLSAGSDGTPVQAVPETGHRFVAWSDGSTDNPRNDANVLADITVTAEFTAITPVFAFDQWAAQNGLAGLNAHPAAVPHADGTRNLLKYAFNLDATRPDARSLTPETGISGLPVLVRSDSPSPPEGEPAPPPVFRLEFLCRKNSGLIYTPLQMDHPGGGPRSPMTGLVTTTDLDETWQRVSIEQPMDPGAPARFFTVEVSLPDAPP
jgi:hypothetical protein